MVEPLPTSLLVLSLSLVGKTVLASNQSDCNLWCGGRSDCDFCAKFCGLDARSIQDFTQTSWGNPWYSACQKYSTATRLNKEDCDRWCDANNNDPNASIYCDRCDVAGCNILTTSQQRNFFWDWYGNGYHAFEDFDKATQRKMTKCQSWCAAEGGTCDYCSDNLFCGWQWPSEARIIESFGWEIGSYGWPAYACQTAATATRLNKEDCDRWCDAHNDNPGTGNYCDRCVSGGCPLFTSEERHLSWFWYGDGYRACEDKNAASQRRKMQCEQYCSSNPANCNYCKEGSLCDAWAKTITTFSGYGSTYAACKNEILPLPGFTTGSSKSRFDLVFVMDKSYKGDKEQFLNDAKKHAISLTSIHPFSRNIDKINFYYASGEGDVHTDTSFIGSNCGSWSSLPSGLMAKSLFADAYVVFHNQCLIGSLREGCALPWIQDCALPSGLQWILSSSGPERYEYKYINKESGKEETGYPYSEFIHEIGHAFGLADEYRYTKELETDMLAECKTFYWRPWETNIWDSEISCHNRADVEKWDKKGCYKFTNCQSIFGYWKHGDPLLTDDIARYNDNNFSFIMNSSEYCYNDNNQDGKVDKNGYGYASERIIQSIFNMFSSRLQCNEQSVMLKMNINQEGVQLLETKPVAGCSPNCLLNGGEFAVKTFSATGALINECGFLDPRRGYAQSDASSGPTMLDEAKFNIILPLSGKIARADIVEDSTGKTLVSADLPTYATGENGKPVADPGPQRTVEFSNSGVTLDGSKSYDPDGDPLTYEWSWQAGAASGVSPTALLVPGTENVTLTVSDGELSDSYSVEITVEEAAPPAVGVTSPTGGAETQGRIRLTADASDRTGVAKVSFYVREPDDAEGVPVNQEDLGGFLFEGSRKDGKWELAFDTVQLLDGHYVALAHSADELGNEGWSKAARFGIRNWQLAALLPSSQNNKAGRTMPLKFSVRMKQAADPAQSFIRNEELEIRVYDTASPANILQTFHYGEGSDAYRIDDLAGEYIANFKTAKGITAEYAVEVWRANTDWMIGKFSFKTVK